MEAAAAESQNQRPFESYDPKSYDTCFMQNKNQQQCTLQHRLWKTNQFFHLPHNHNNNNQNFWNSNLIMQLQNSKKGPRNPIPETKQKKKKKPQNVESFYDQPELRKQLKFT